jgi:hypothetical protein
MMHSTTLTNNDIACFGRFAAKNLYTQALTYLITAVF